MAKIRCSNLFGCCAPQSLAFFYVKKYRKIQEEEERNCAGRGIPGSTPNIRAPRVKLINVRYNAIKTPEGTCWQHR